MKLQVRIDSACEVAAGIRALELSSVDGSELPAWEPGAHVQVLMNLPGGATSRAYSLCGAPGGRGYRIAVQREAGGGGGSVHVHDVLRAGDRIVISAPVNGFPLAPGAGPVELVAGGIGITPLAAMAGALADAGRAHRMTVFSRAEAVVPFLDELRAAGPVELVTGADLAAARAEMAGVARRAAETGAEVYFCGPDGFADALRAACQAQGIGEGRLHSERFVNPSQFDAGRAFSIRLASTGEVCEVPAGVSALDALTRDFGLELPCDCRAGYCGSCVQRVVRGIPEHRDTSLGAEERLGNGVMCLCVSRAVTPEITIDL